MNTSRTTVVLGVRIVLAGGGVIVTALTVFKLAQLPPPSGGDGELVAIIGSGIIILSLGLATVSIIIPTMVGWSDPIGFNRRQRTALRGAGGLIGSGLILAVLYGSLSVIPAGIFVWVLFIVLAAAVVSVTLLWRTVALLAGRLSHGDQDRP
ncbi:hypothetical protein halTADL_3459 [Halohasta litchfieldiae]|jgi:hypothetical protein|uniref:Uncharacterized protein n=1 Tax=Halohasta litchfieldiae TaxID=1073996 RepID=A0A1H6XQ22_9EURY|nr:hypothetical protein [Halohasta litchfieldiae]ATW90160.1 hypothetical protein halTADL_3459 [Halohasta litchfieldiae]SEJ30286.1 hypothetical protein SAMN05444271_1433 [Halohasta litchfieldiae]